MRHRTGSGRVWWCYVCVSLDSLCRLPVQAFVYCARRIPAHLRISDSWSALPACPNIINRGPHFCGWEVSIQFAQQFDISSPVWS